MAEIKPIPEGYPRVMPYLCVDGAAEAIEFYTAVFGAAERMRMPGDTPEKVGHAELEIGDSIVMLSDPFPDMGAVDPKTIGGSPVAVVVYVEDVDKAFARALELGAKELRPLQNEFYGDRVGGIEDPWGHRWSIHTHIEDVSPEEMSKRMAEAQG